MLIRLLAPVFFFVLFVVGAIFLSVAFVIGAVAAVAVWGWLWWKTRQLRKQGVTRPPRDAQGHVIEGEYTLHEHDETRDIIGERPSYRNGEETPR